MFVAPSRKATELHVGPWTMQSAAEHCILPFKTPARPRQGQQGRSLHGHAKGAEPCEPNAEESRVYTIDFVKET